MIKVVIFDFDDTIYTGKTWDNWPDFLFKYLRKVLKKDFESFCKKYEIKKDVNTRDVVLWLDKEGYDVKKFNKLYQTMLCKHSPNVKVLPDEFFKKLSEKYPLYMVSMSPQRYLKYYTKKYKVNRKYFKELQSLNFLGEVKSKSVNYIDIMKKENVSAEEVLVVGDNYKHDIVPAIELGINVIHFKGDHNQIYDYFTEKEILSCEEFKTAP